MNYILITNMVSFFLFEKKNNTAELLLFHHNMDIGVHVETFLLYFSVDKKYRNKLSNKTHLYEYSPFLFARTSCYIDRQH